MALLPNNHKSSQALMAGLLPLHSHLVSNMIYDYISFMRVFFLDKNEPDVVMWALRPTIRGIR